MIVCHLFWPCLCETLPESGRPEFLLTLSKSLLEGHIRPESLVGYLEEAIYCSLASKSVGQHSRISNFSLELSYECSSLLLHPYLVLCNETAFQSYETCHVCPAKSDSYL